MTTQSFRIGDVVTAENVDEVPEWSCVESGDHVWRRVGKNWQTVSFGFAEPAKRLMASYAGGESVAVDRRIVGLNCTAADRVGLGRELAVQGWAPAVEWLRRHKLDVPSLAAVAHDDFVQATAPLVYGPPSIGTELTPEQIRYLPMGAVVAESSLWGFQRMKGDDWRVISLGQTDLTTPLDEGSPFVECNSGRLVALDAPLGRCRVLFLQALADQGFEPARKALTSPASLRLSVTAETGAVQDALGRLADEMATLTPPLPAVGEMVTPEMLDRLPVGAVVDTRDGSNTPWAIKCEDGWDYIGREVLLGGRWYEASDMRTVLPRYRPTLVALDAPPRPGDALRAWCVERGYERAIVVERELTEQQVRKQIIDERNAPPQNQEMALTITTSAGTFTQQQSEDAQQFAARVTRESLKPVQPSPQPLVFENTQPNALTRFVDAFKGIGADFAKDGVKAVVDSKALVLVDGSRLALHGAAAQIAEWVGGESAVEKVQRATQNPLAAGIEDVLVVIGATLTGQQGLAAAVRGRVVRRIVDGAEGAIVAKGAAVVTQLAQAAKALGAASAAAELPAESTATQTEGEVQS